MRWPLPIVLTIILLACLSAAVQVAAGARRAPIVVLSARRTSPRGSGPPRGLRYIGPSPTWETRKLDESGMASLLNRIACRDRTACRALRIGRLQNCPGLTCGADAGRARVARAGSAVEVA